MKLMSQGHKVEVGHIYLIKVDIQIILSWCEAKCEQLISLNLIKALKIWPISGGSQRFCWKCKGEQRIGQNKNPNVIFHFNVLLTVKCIISIRLVPFSPESITMGEKIPDRLFKTSCCVQCSQMTKKYGIIFTFQHFMGEIKRRKDCNVCVWRQKSRITNENCFYGILTIHMFIFETLSSLLPYVPMFIS